MLNQANDMRPILFINFVDLALKSKWNSEDLYRKFQSFIDYGNKSIVMDEMHVKPSNGTVVFGSALDGCVFTLEQCVRTEQFKIDDVELRHPCDKENFVNIFKLISKMFDAIMKKDSTKTAKRLDTFGITLKPEDRDKNGKALLDVAQKNRLAKLYGDPKTDEAAVAISNCDAEAGLMV